jgi:ribosomal protein S14
MKSIFIKDRNKRNLYKIIEKKKIILNYILNNLKYSLDDRNYAYYHLKQICYFSNITKITNRCVLSNRSRAIYRKFKLSRIFFKQYALEGLLMGVKKAS